MTIYICQDTVESILTGVYDAWASRKGHSQVRLALDGNYNYELFCDYISVETDLMKADKVRQSIIKKISGEAWMMIYRSALSREASKADDIYRFLVGGFHFGASVLNMMAEPAVFRIHELNRAVGNEAHYYREFLRFDAMEEQVLFGKIRPRDNILTLLTPHFADRISGENFLILDVGRNLASVHPANGDWFLTGLSQEEAEGLLNKKPDQYRDLWKTFYQAVAIEERKNPRQQRTMLPLHYREFMSEFLP